MKRLGIAAIIAIFAVSALAPMASATPDNPRIEQGKNFVIAEASFPAAYWQARRSGHQWRAYRIARNMQILAETEVAALAVKQKPIYLAKLRRCRDEYGNFAYDTSLKAKAMAAIAWRKRGSTSEGGLKWWTKRLKVVRREAAISEALFWNCRTSHILQ